MHCTIEETGSTGIICIISHLVFCHESDHSPSLMGNLWLEGVYIAKLNELKQSEGPELTDSTGNETVVTILKREGSQGITIGGFQGKCIFDMQV